MRRLWAVARHTLIEASRARVTAIFVIALAAAVLLLPATITKGTLREQIQTYLVWSLTLAGVMLSLLSILLGCGLLCGEIRKRHIFAPLSKPVSRWQYIAGRWAGIAMLQTVLVGAVGAGIYVMTRYMRERSADPYERRDADEHVLVARDRHRPDPPPVERAVQNRLANLEKQDPQRFAQMIRAYGGGKEGRQRLIEQYTQETLMQVHTTGPGGALVWQFTDLRRPSGQDATIQLTFAASAGVTLEDNILHSFWEIGHRDPDGNWVRADSFARSDLIRSTVTFTVPARHIGPDGSLRAVFHNRRVERYGEQGVAVPNPFSVTILSDDVSILYAVGSFWPNFLRAMLLVLFFQMFLAALSVLTGTFLSFPVACLACFVLLVLGMAASFLTDEMTGIAADTVTTIGVQVSAALLFFVPDFGSASSTEKLVDGLAIPWLRVGTMFLKVVLIQSGLSLLAAAGIFTWREMARVVV